MSLPPASSVEKAPVVSRHQRKISSSTEFKELTKKDAIYQLSLELEKLSLTTRNNEEKDLFDGEVSGFKDLYQKFIVGSGPIQWDKIEPLPSDGIINYSSLNEPRDRVRDMLNQLVVIKLNGGLGMFSIEHCWSFSYVLIFEYYVLKVLQWAALVQNRWFLFEVI